MAATAAKPVHQVGVGRVAERLVPLLERLLGGDLPIRVRGWDGSEVGPQDAPLVVVRSRRAVRRLLWQPNEVGLARAYVAGELDIGGDLCAALDVMSFVARRAALRSSPLTAAERGELTKAAVMLGAVGPQPKPPAEEADLPGVPHTRAWDEAAIAHHYDIGERFFELLLGPSLVYSSAHWRLDDEEQLLEDAQRAKLDLICRKLGLAGRVTRPRLLDAGCGWGALAVHAAREYGARVLAVTLSGEQADFTRKRVAEEGVVELVEVRHGDVREFSLDDGDEPYDAIASIGIGEHVGSERYPSYATTVHGLLRPGGRLLVQQASRRPGRVVPGPSFVKSYVHPDGDLLPLGETVSLLESAGFEVRDVESLREHHARTVRCWLDNLEAAWDEAVALTSEGRARVWRLYLAASALGAEAGRTGVEQVLAQRLPEQGRVPMPSRADRRATS
jgi:cyclopropane-fatty-acyl-phospholipid synthase